MGIHDGPELNRPIIQFTLDKDREPFPIAVYKVSDETYPSAVVYSDGSVRVGTGSAVPAALPTLTAAPIAVTGNDGDNTALVSLLAALETLGLIDDSGVTT